MRGAVVTGATGVVGTALVRELIRNRVRVLVLCREGSQKNDRIPVHPLVERAYCSLDELRRFEAAGQYDVFYHLAWEGTTGQGRNDMHLQNRNVACSLDAVELAERLGCRTFIGVGSQAEYGSVDGVLRPDTPTFPTMGYGIGKLSAGLMTRERAHQLGLRHSWVRIVSIYGPYDGAQSMVMSVIRTLLVGETPQLTKGEQTWNYLYSADAARAFYLLGCGESDGRTYVLGSSDVRPLRAYIEELRDVVRPGAELAFGAISYYPHQAMRLEADISDWKREFGWEPSWKFEDGIREILRVEGIREKNIS